MLRRLSRKELNDRQILSKFLDFLDSSIWALPVATFIEQRSIVFDRQQGDVKLYEEIHKEFCGLIDTLVECFCEDIKIAADRLVQALKTLDKEKLNMKQRTNLEPLAAAQDFMVFVPMMMRKNVELQLQALQMIEFMCGLIPTVLQLEDGESLCNKSALSPEETERYVLISVMRQSKEEFEALGREELREELENVARSGEIERNRLEMERTKEDTLVNKAIAGEVNNSAVLQKPAEKLSRRASTGGVKAELVGKEKKMRENIDKPVTKRTEERMAERPNTAKRVPQQPLRDGKKIPIKQSPAREIRRLPTVGRKTEMVESGVEDTKETEDRLAEKGSGSDGFQYGPRERNVNDVHTLLRETQRLNSADVRSRAEYLRMQRDKLLALKKKERDKQMQEVTSRAAQERPRTAKAARGIMRGGRGPNPSTNDDVIAARKALVEKLKTEVATSSN